MSPSLWEADLQSLQNFWSPGLKSYMANCPAKYPTEDAMSRRTARRKSDSVALVGKDSDQTLAPDLPPRLAGCYLALSSLLVKCYHHPSASVIFCFPLTAAEGRQTHLNSDKTHPVFVAFCGDFAQERGSSRRCWP